jgi:hypothetical protein
MMHRPEDFAEHFIGLLKNSGSSGSSGSGVDNALNNKAFASTTGAQPREPVKSEWFSGVQFSGSTNNIANQSLAGARTTGTTGTTGTATFEEGLNADSEGRAPAEWHAILAELEQRSCPDWLSPDRWNDVLADAENFLSRWGAAAHALGWTALDLFGVHPTVPASRFDLMGLLPLIQGGTVIALTEDGATLRRMTGAVLNYRRCTAPGAVLISEVIFRTAAPNGGLK